MMQMVVFNKGPISHLKSQRRRFANYFSPLPVRGEDVVVVCNPDARLSRPVSVPGSCGCGVGGHLRGRAQPAAAHVVDRTRRCSMLYTVARGTSTTTHAIPISVKDTKLNEITIYGCKFEGLTSFMCSALALDDYVVATC
jgi:hypothetical protein